MPVSPTFFFSEIIGPIVLVAVTLVPYLYINAQTGVTPETNPDVPEDQIKATNSLIRVAAVAFGPVAINAGVLAGLFAMACCMGPLLSMCCKRFGAVLAAIAHGVSVVMLLASFEVMFFLEGWDFSKTVLGMIASIALQRLLFKFIIALALTREFKADTSNIAWWTGKWYALGWHTISQPGREFLCKITELGFFAADFILGHLILFMLLPPLLVPYIDKFHSVMLFWLRPSRQIRPPIYSLKQTKLRRRRVIRYSILYFFMFFVFVLLIGGPLIASPFITNLPELPMNLMQPTGLNFNDTTSSQTGTALAAPAETGTGSAGTSRNDAPADEEPSASDEEPSADTEEVTAPDEPEEPEEPSLSEEEIDSLKRLV